MNVLKSSDLPKLPYSEPEGPVKALSLAMKLEDLCVSLGFMSLSAPQVGVPQNLFVYWSNYPEEPKVFSVFIGADYAGTSDRFLSLESCASFPGERFGVMRYSSVDAAGKTVVSEGGKILIRDETRSFSGPVAALIQHEVDHTKGILLNFSGERIFFR